jgi:mRNA interferase RelE/StbE
MYAAGVVKNDIPELPRTARKPIRSAIESRLTISPIHYGAPLRYSATGHRRLIVGPYRVIYRIDAKLRTVYIVAIKHKNQANEH